MYQILSRDNPLGYLLMLLVLLAMRIRLFTSPEHYAFADTNMVGGPLWHLTFGGLEAGGLASVVVVVLICLLAALLVNYVANRYSLSPQKSCLAGFFFALSCGVIRRSVALHPAIVFALFLIVGLDRLFTGMRSDQQQKGIFWSAVWVSVGSLFWVKGIVFLPVLFMLTVFIRTCDVRSLVAGAIGVVGVWMTAITALLFSDDFFGRMHSLADAFLCHLEPWNPRVRTFVYLIVMMTPVVLSILALRVRLVQLTVVEGRRLRIAQWIYIVAVALALLPYFSVELQMVAAIGSALLLPQFLQNIKSPMAPEVMTWLMVIVSVWYQFV